MKKFKLLLSAAVLTFMIFDAFAGTRDNAEIIGYSPDGEYAALKISGIEDGSGFYYISIRFLNVFKNRFAGPKIFAKQTDDGTVQAVNNEVYRKARPYFEKFRIDRSITPLALKLEGSELRKSFKFKDKKHVIQVTEIDTGIQCSSMSGQFPGKGFSIALDSRILDKVPVPGDSTGCTFAYLIDRALYYRGYVIIIYRASTPGFEGPDSRVLFSSAALD